MDEETETKAIEKWLRMVDKPLETKEGDKQEIDETIRRWFIKTNDAFKKPYDGQDLLIHGWCLASVALALNYFESTLILLNNERKLPAKALLRVLGEFVAKMVWCLKGKSESADELRNRFTRWGKTTKIEQRRIRKEVLKINTYTEQQRAQLEELIKKDSEEIDKIKLRRLPSIRELFENIFPPQSSSLARGGMYLQFLRAIHLDIIALENTMDLTRYVSEGKIDCMGDIRDSIEDLKLLCFAHAYIFLTEIWDYFGLDVDSIKSDYERLTEEKGLGND